ncbi:MAG: class I SAM-dependent methyltransferase [Candidatus Gorgyraea atricola]|nr:class I SAM-dependent methyltransferase [Candidatus Gorgyraea atricola]
MSIKNVTRDYGFFEGFLAKKRAEIADRLIPPASKRGKILDIGCGNYPYFLNSIDFAEKYGVDQNLSNSRNDIPQNIKLQKFNIEKENRIDFPDEYFDVVTMLAVLEHIDPGVLPERIREICRILKPKGIFIITTPASWTVPILSVMAKLKLISPVEIREHKVLYSRSRISEALTGNKFHSEKIMSGYFELFMNIWLRAEK